MIFKKSLLLFMATGVIYVSAAYAQPNQYADFQRAISENRSSAAYIEKIEAQARTPNAPYRPSGVDLKAFYNNKIKSTDYSLSPEQLQFKEKYEAEEKAKITSMLYKQAQKSAGMAPS